MLNYHADALDWHKLLRSFCSKRDVDIHDQTPFFWWLIDHRVYDISEPILTVQFELFKRSEYCTCVYYEEPHQSLLSPGQ